MGCFQIHWPWLVKTRSQKQESSKVRQAWPFLENREQQQKKQLLYDRAREINTVNSWLAVYIYINRYKSKRKRDGTRLGEIFGVWLERKRKRLWPLNGHERLFYC